MTSPITPLAQPLSVTISSGTSITSATNLKGRVLVGIIMPAAWDAATITFQMSDTEAGTYVNVIGISESELELTAAASQYLAIDPVNLYGCNYIKVRSGNAAAAVNQTADRALILMVANDRIQ